jgi:homeobox protein cut-like
METQISDLQTEASRLIRSLESQKDASDLASKEVRKKVDELVRERDGVTKDLEALREKITLYADYDEIKRELEIMKVRPPSLPS